MCGGVRDVWKDEVMCGEGGGCVEGEADVWRGRGCVERVMCGDVRRVRVMCERVRVMCGGGG